MNLLSIYTIYQRLIQIPYLVISFWQLGISILRKMETIISPTGKSIRLMDCFGSGLFNAPRGNEKHNGVDFICEPGQVVVSPVDGIVIRQAFPYTDKDYTGVLLANDSLSLKMIPQYPFIF